MTKEISWKLLEVFKFVLMIPHVIRIYFKFGEWEAIYSESSSMPSPSRGWVLFFMSSFRHIFPKTFGAISSSLFLFLLFQKKEFYTQIVVPNTDIKKDAHRVPSCQGNNSNKNFNKIRCRISEIYIIVIYNT